MYLVIERISVHTGLGRLNTFFNRFVPTYGYQTMVQWGFMYHDQVGPQYK